MKAPEDKVVCLTTTVRPDHISLVDSLIASGQAMTRSDATRLIFDLAMATLRSDAELPPKTANAA